MVFQIPPHGVRNPVGPRFRGEWNQWGEIIRYKDFSQETSIDPTIIEVESNVNAPGPTVATVTGPELRGMSNTPSSGRPEVEGAQAVHTYISPTIINTGKHYINILLSGLQLPVEYSVTKVSFSFYTANTYTGVLYSAHVDHIDYGPEYTDTSTSGTWRPQTDITPPNMSSSSKVGVRVRGDQGSTNRNATVGITNITVWGVPTDSRYILGDTVSYGGELWRNIITGNNDEPGTSARWQKVSHSILPPDLRSLNDVDLGGLYDKAVLTYHHEDQKWHPGDKTEDQRNFRGDWQDPADTILWASDFSDPADINTLVPQSPVTVTHTATQGSETGRPASTHSAQCSLVASGTSRVVTFDLTALGGAYVSRIEWLGSSYTSHSSTGDGVALYLDTANLSWAHLSTVGWSPWAQQEIAVEAILPDVGVRLYVGGTYGDRTTRHMLTDLRVYGALDNDDLYTLGSVVYHDGFYWRSLFPLNADEPSEESAKWEKIGDIFAQKTYALSGLTDVDLTGKYGGAFLKYDEEQQVWRPGSYAPDYRNFRGDWQDPADTLLWSTDFSNVDDLNYFVSTVDGTFNGWSVTQELVEPTPIPTKPTSNWCLRQHFLTATTSANIGSIQTLFDTSAVPELAGKYVKTIQWDGAAKSNDPDSVSVQVLVGGSVSTTILNNSAAWADTAARTSIVEGANSTWASEIRDTGGSNGNSTIDHYIANFKVYGTLDNEDLYRLNDVVAHDGYFWRSLFNLNAEEPSEESEKWVRITEFVVDNHKQPQGTGRVEDLPSSTSRSAGGWSMIYQEVTPKEDFWLDKVRFYTGGGGDCIVYVRDLQGAVLRTGTFNTGLTTTTTPEWFEVTLDAPLHLTAESSYLVGFEPTTSVNTHRASGLYDGTMWRTRRAVLNGFDWIGGASTYNETHGMGLVEFDSTT